MSNKNCLNRTLVMEYTSKMKFNDSFLPVWANVNSPNSPESGLTG